MDRAALLRDIIEANGVLRENPNDVRAQATLEVLQAELNRINDLEMAQINIQANVQVQKAKIEADMQANVQVQVQKAKIEADTNLKKYGMDIENKRKNEESCLFTTVAKRRKDLYSNTSKALAVELIVIANDKDFKLKRGPNWIEQLEIPKEYSKECDLRDDMKKLCDKIQNKRVTSKEITIGNGRSDILVFNEFPFLSNVDIVLEAKLARKIHTEELKKEAKGQLLEYLQAILKIQPTREFIIGVLFTEYNAVFIRAENDGIYESKAVNLKDCMKTIMWLIKNERTGYKNTENDILYLKFLGKGKTAMVYKIKSGNSEFAMKRSNDSVQNEVEILGILKDQFILNIPTVEKSDENNFTMSPVGNPLSLRDWRSDHAVQILHTLEAAHGAGIVHRDVRPSNIILHNGSAILIDWGFAVRCNGQSVEYCGAPKPYFPGEIDVHHIPSYSDDLHALLVCVFDAFRIQASEMSIDSAFGKCLSLDWQSQVQNCLDRRYNELENFFNSIWQ